MAAFAMLVKLCIFLTLLCTLIVHIHAMPVSNSEGSQAVQNDAVHSRSKRQFGWGLGADAQGFLWGLLFHNYFTAAPASG